MLSAGTGHLRPQQINHTHHDPPYSPAATHRECNLLLWATIEASSLASSAFGQPPEPVRVVPSASKTADDDGRGKGRSVCVFFGCGR